MVESGRKPLHFRPAIQISAAEGGVIIDPGMTDRYRCVASYFQIKVAGKLQECI